MPKKILLTGATGFLGSHLLSALLANGHNVVVIKRSTSNLERISKYVSTIKMYDIDTVDLEKIFKIELVDVVIHAATNYSRQKQDEVGIIKTNVLFGIELIRNAEKYGVRAFLNTDTFFNTPEFFGHQILPYTLSKKQFSDWLKYRTWVGINVINLKIHHAYGPNDSTDKFISWLHSSLIEGAKNIELTKGTQLRDFIYIDDVISAFLYILNNLVPDDLAAARKLDFYSEYNVCTGVKTSVREFCEELYKQTCQKYNVKSKLKFGALEFSPLEIMDVQNDCRSLRQLGWSPTISVNDGIQRLLDAEKCT